MPGITNINDTDNNRDINVDDGNGVVMENVNSQELGNTTETQINENANGDFINNDDDVFTVNDRLEIPENTSENQSDDNDNDDANDVVSKNKSSTLEKFYVDVRSILEENFKDQNNYVTVVSLDRTRQNSTNSKLNGLYHVVAGTSESSERKKCIRKLLLRMPLPCTISTMKDHVTTDAQLTTPDQRPLLDSTNSAGEGPVCVRK